MRTEDKTENYFHKQRNRPRALQLVVNLVPWKLIFEHIVELRSTYYNKLKFNSKLNLSLWTSSGPSETAKLTTSNYLTTLQRIYPLPNYVGRGSAWIVKQNILVIVRSPSVFSVRITEFSEVPKPRLLPPIQLANSSFCSVGFNVFEWLTRLGISLNK